MTDLAEFLLARIAEDEQFGWDFERDPETRLPRFWTERMRAECEAKRRIVERLAVMQDEMGWDGIDDQFLALLALPYADHPDYRQEWRP